MGMELPQTRMNFINTKFTKHGKELIAHILDKLPVVYRNVVPTFGGGGGPAVKQLA